MRFLKEVSTNQRIFWWWIIGHNPYKIYECWKDWAKVCYWSRTNIEDEMKWYWGAPKIYRSHGGKLEILGSGKKSWLRHSYQWKKWQPRSFLFPKKFKPCLVLWKKVLAPSFFFSRHKSWQCTFFFQKVSAPSFISSGKCFPCLSLSIRPRKKNL